MTRILRRQKPEDAERILEEICKKIHTDYVAPTSLDLKAFKTLIGDTSNMFHGVLYQAFAEEIRTELNMGPKEFYNLYGSIAAIVDPTFKENAHLPIPVILWSVSVYNRGKNSVTDVREISTRLVKRDGIKYRQSLVERIVLPKYADDLMKLFSLEDAGQLLLQDFWTTEGVYQGLAEYKGSKATLQLIEPNYEIEKPEVFYRHWKKILEYIAKKKDGIEKKKPFLEDSRYQTELYTTNHGFPIPLYARYLVEYQRTAGSKKKTKKSFADEMEINLMTNAKVFQVQTQAAAELERRVRDAEEHATREHELRVEAEEARDIAVIAQGEAEQARSELERIYKRFTHDIGNSMNMLAVQASRLYHAAERARSIDDLAEAQAFNAKQADALRSLSELSKINTGIANASLWLLDKKYDTIRKESRMSDLHNMFAEFLPLVCQVDNDILTNYGQDQDYNPAKLMHPKIEFEEGDYKTIMNESLFYSFAFNIYRNSYRATADSKKREIEIYGRDLGDSIELKFRDNGYGMDETTTQILLTADQKVVSSEGTGLGFFTIREFISYYKGTYDINTQQGDNSYTELVVTLPKEQVEIQRRNKRITFGGPRR